MLRGTSLHTVQKNWCDIQFFCSVCMPTSGNLGTRSGSVRFQGSLPVLPSYQQNQPAHNIHIHAWPTIYIFRFCLTDLSWIFWCPVLAPPHQNISIALIRMLIFNKPSMKLSCLFYNLTSQLSQCCVLYCGEKAFIPFQDPFLPIALPMKVMAPSFVGDNN